MQEVVESDVPGRMDRLPWSAWHARIIAALGTSWLLDGLEVTLVGSLSGLLESSQGLSLSDQQVTGAATLYLAGAVLGALLFGYLTDRYGRRRLFLITLATYSLATLGSAFSVGFISLGLCRLFTGLGIGGEYAAINSAVDELIPGKVRGTVDLVVNATYWVGAAIGSVATLMLLHSQRIPKHLGWRFAFGVGGTLGMGVLLLRLTVPESPRWLMLRGYEREARLVVDGIERRIAKGGSLPAVVDKPLRLRTRSHTPLREIFRSMVGENRRRSIVGLVLMIGQAFFFNAVFFSYGLIAKDFYHVDDSQLPAQLLPFAIGSFLGPVLLGWLFDRVGRKPMIALTYGLSGAVLLVVAYTFGHNMLSAHALSTLMTITFFIASSAGSAAYLTVSEIFPLEIRAFAIAIFYAFGTLAGGVAAPVLFGALIASGSHAQVGLGYLLASVLMFAGAICELVFGIEAAGRSLESISKPLQSVD